MNKYRIKSKILSTLTEAINKLSLLEDDFTSTPPKMEEDGSFSSDIETNNKPNMQGIEVEDKSDDQEQLSKQELIDQAVEKLKTSLDISAELDKIIQQIKGIDDQVSNEWKLNKEGNDVYLQSKDAHIFQQNDNILLSHDGQIEVFHSVQELHNWLEEHNYPMPPAVTIHESSDEELLNLLQEDYEDIHAYDYAEPGWYVIDAEDKIVSNVFDTEEKAMLWLDIHGNSFETKPTMFKTPFHVEYIG